MSEKQWTFGSVGRAVLAVMCLVVVAWGVGCAVDLVF